MIKLLLVEDDTNLSYIIQSALEDMIGDYEVSIAHNGKEGLEAYHRDKPDVIVADIEMPIMDGYEMVRRIRETDQEIPILFSSARVSPKDVVKGYELGVNNYVKKPFLPEELDAHVHALLRMKQGTTEKEIVQQTFTVGNYTLNPIQATLLHTSGSTQLLTPTRNRHPGTPVPQTGRSGPPRSHLRQVLEYGRRLFRLPQPRCLCYQTAQTDLQR